MRSAVAKLLRDGRGDELGARDLEEDLMAHLPRLGFSADLVQEQASRLSRAREFIAKGKYQCHEEEMAFQEEGKVEEEVSEEEVELEGSDEEWLDWRVVVEEQEAGILETKPRLKRVKKEQEPVAVPPGFLVAYGHKLRCLHYVGRCWRLPGRDIKKWDYFGQQQPSPSEYDHFCKHCWGKGATPGGDSEATRVEEDSGSSSTDA